MTEFNSLADVTSLAEIKALADISSITQIGSLIVAGLAVLVGPIASYYIAKKQIWASTVTSSRQKWINELREDVASFLQQTALGAELSIDITRSHNNEELNHKILKALTKAGELELLIKLRLNPNEKEHQDLLSAIYEFSRMANLIHNTGEASTKEFKKFKKSVVEKAQVIFKKEWERIKAQK